MDFLGIIAGASSFMFTLVNLATAFKGVDLGTQAIVLAGSIGGWILFLWALRHYWTPKKKWTDPEGLLD